MMVARPVVLPWETPKGRRPTREERAEVAPLADGRRNRSAGAGATYYDRDDGCNEAPHCLTCPLPECRYDRDQRRGMKVGPNVRTEALLEDVKKLRGEGLGPTAVARKLGRSPRMANRYFAMIDGRKVY